LPIPSSLVILPHMKSLFQSDRRRKHERNAIVTLAFGKTNYLALTLPTIQAYASRIQVPLITIRDQILSGVSPAFEKWQLSNFLDEYDRILYLDADIVVTPHAPDIFKLPIPKSHLAAVIDKSDNAIREHPDELGFKGWGNHDFPILEQLFGPIRKPQEQLYYFNAGVMLVSKSHQKIFRMLKDTANTITDDTRLRKTGEEQSTVNYFMNKEGIPLHPLDKQWNHILGHQDPAPPWIQDSYFAHYAGTSSKRWAILSHFPELTPYAQTNPFAFTPLHQLPSAAEVKMDRCHFDLIYGLLVSHKPRSVLELGMGSGAGTNLILAAFDYNNIPNVHLTCVDNWLDWDYQKPKEVKQYEDCGVEVITSTEYDFVTTCDSTYDFIISDTDHFRAEQWFDKTLSLLNPGGLLIYHDVTNPEIPNLARILQETREQGLIHLLLNKSTRLDEHCERGLLVIQKAPANES